MRILALIMVLVSTAAFAETKIGIVDLREVREKSTASASLTRQITSIREQHQKQYEKLGEELAEEDKKLAQQQSILSQDAFMQKQQAFREKVMNAQKEIKEKGQALEQAASKAFKQVTDEISNIVKVLAESKNLDLVLSKNVTLYSSDKMSITSEVIEQLNTKVPDVKLEIE